MLAPRPRFTFVEQQGPSRTHDSPLIHSAAGVPASDSEILPESLSVTLRRWTDGQHLSKGDVAAAKVRRKIRRPPHWALQRHGSMQTCQRWRRDSVGNPK